MHFYVVNYSRFLGFTHTLKINTNILLNQNILGYSLLSIYD